MTPASVQPSKLFRSGTTVLLYGTPIAGYDDIYEDHVLRRREAIELAAEINKAIAAHNRRNLMKTLKYALALAAILFATSTASAANIGTFWTDLKSKSDLHLGDNVAPGTFYNLKKGAAEDEKLLGGVVSTLYTYRIVDLNFTLVKGLKTGDRAVPGASIGLNLNKLIAPIVTKIAPALGENAESPLFERLRISGFYSKDFAEHKEAYGVAGYWVFGAVTPE